MQDVLNLKLPCEEWPPQVVARSNLHFGKTIWAKHVHAWWSLEAGEAAADSAVDSGEGKLCSQWSHLNSFENTDVSGDAKTVKACSWSSAPAPSLGPECTCRSSLTTRFPLLLIPDLLGSKLCNTEHIIMY